MTTDSSILAPIAALTLPDAGSMTTRAQRALAEMEAFEITDAETYGLAAEELQAIKTRAKALEDQRTGITGPLNTVLRNVNALFKGPGDLLEKAEAIIKRKMLGYQAEQQRIADEKRREAEAAAAAERSRQAELAAAAQREAEAQAKAAAEAKAKGDEQGAQLAASAAQRAAAEAQTAAVTAQMVVAGPVAVAKPAVKGISTSTKVDFDVTSLRLLVAYIATGKVYEEGDSALAHPELLGLIKVDEVKLRAYVRGLGLACNLPGVRVFADQVLSARAAA